MKALNLSNKIYGVKIWEAFVYAGVFVFFSVLYYTALYINRGGDFSTHSNLYFNLQNFIQDGGLDYFLKFWLSLPIWWLMFRKLKGLILYKRLLLHLLTFSLYISIWQLMYYWITEHLHLKHLVSTGQIWDTYITGLFYMVVFGFLHAYAYFKENQEKQKTEYILREATLRSELTALKAQLNPHFLYNVFNTINASIPSGMEKTRQMIAELSDLFRYQLQASQADLVPLGDELEFTRKYLDLEKARFEERLEVEILCDESLLHEMIPPMLLQPLAENAIKHGISPLISGGKIKITVQKFEKKLAFCVADTGVGIRDKNKLIGSGTGLTNTELRLNKMYNSALHFSDSIPHGLTVNFVVG